MVKKIIYCGGVLKDIRRFESRAKQRLLRMLDMLRQDIDLHPKEFKYMGIVGSGVYELRVKTDKPYRVFYVAKFDNVIYVLHAFVKKSEQTETKEILKGRGRYKALVNRNKGLEL